MSHKGHIERLKELEITLPRELDNCKADNAPLPVQLLNRLRKWHDRKFHAGYPSIHSTAAGDLATLTGHEAALHRDFVEWSRKRSDLSAHYSRQYRGGYTLNYNFAVWAVFLAVISLGILYAGSLYPGQEPPKIIEFIVLLLGGIKFLLLFTIFLNTHQSEHWQFNNRAIAYRYILEQFRIMSYISLFGIRRIPPPSVSRFVSDAWNENNPVQLHFKSETEKIFFNNDSPANGTAKNIVYGERLVPLLEFIKTGWVKAQYEYHYSKYRKFTAINETLEKDVNKLNIVVLVAIGIDVILGLVGVLHWMSPGMHKFLQYYTTPLILVTATIIPALVASYNGKRSQAETKKEVEREAFMLGQLRDLLGKEETEVKNGDAKEREPGKYDRLIEKIKSGAENPDSVGSFTQEAIQLVHQTAQIMIDEVADWTFVYTKEVMEV